MRGLRWFGLLFVGSLLAFATNTMSGSWPRSVLIAALGVLIVHFMSHFERLAQERQLEAYVLSALVSSTAIR